MIRHSARILSITIVIMGFVVTSLLISSCKTTTDINAPDDAQIREAYKKAEEAFGWFDLSTMKCDLDDSKQYNGFDYYRVTHDTIKTYAQLVDYLNTLFTDRVVSNLLNENQNLYVDIGGALYTLNASRGVDNTKGNETHEIIREGDTKIVYRVKIEVVDVDTRSIEGYEVHNFNYEYIDGKWLFSNFYPVK